MKSPTGFQFTQFLYYVFKEFNFSIEITIFVVLIHFYENVDKVLVTLFFFTVKAQVVANFTQARRTESERFEISFI